jgi:hypothetical protein
MHTSGMARSCTLHGARFGANGRRHHACKHANVPSTPPGYSRPPLARPRTTRPISGGPGAHMRCFLRCFPRCVLRATACASHSAAYIAARACNAKPTFAAALCAAETNLVLGQLAAPQLAVRRSRRRGGWRQPCLRRVTHGCLRVLAGGAMAGGAAAGVVAISGATEGSAAQPAVWRVAARRLARRLAARCGRR